MRPEEWLPNQGNTIFPDLLQHTFGTAAKALKRQPVRYNPEQVPDWCVVKLVDMN